MKTINKVKSILAASLLAVSVTSCADWLEVKMEDKVMENTLFADYRGYMTALNGVYLSMNDVYSRNLMTGPIDVMAQYYNVTENKNHSLKLYATYAYSDVSLENSFATIWANMYTLLANLNVVIEHTEGSNPLTESQWGIIRGESLALRAFFHFDLLRLFGPIYTENPTMKTIPYQNSSSREIQPMLPANEVMEKILADLAEAETLLRQYDPVITDGVRNEATEDNGVYAYDYSFRQLRMNYYAVKLLQARAYLWMGDKATAYRIATEDILDKVTTDKLVIFPWTTKEQVEAAGKPDCLFSTEVFFSLYNTKRSEIQSAYFSSALRALSNRLTFFGNSLTGEESKIGTFYDDENDLRVKMWKLVEPLQSEIEEAEANGESAQSTLV
ncbi:MAG: RagB/SusD family nutrient uptake outer membrane protein, partial [Duncaniella sp.]|nr:RagB/SusD family nutrient uptake outer membrane protein [Duncaniella sp.]